MEATTVIATHAESQPGENWFAFKMHLDTEALRHLSAGQVTAVYNSTAKLTARLAEVTA
jgi:hypothetical protein